MHFSKNLIVCSSASPKILAFGSHCSANFQPILDCFIPNFKLKYEDSENIKADCVSTVVFNLHQIKRRAFFFGTLGRARYDVTEFSNRNTEERSEAETKWRHTMLYN